MIRIQNPRASGLYVLRLDTFVDLFMQVIELLLEQSFFKIFIQELTKNYRKNVKK